MLGVRGREMQAGTGGRVDPQEQVDLARGIADLTLHLSAEHEQPLAVGERQPGDRGNCRDQSKASRLTH